MIAVRLCGGLGNQLFQYSAGRRLSYELGVPICLDMGWYRRRHKNTTPRTYELGALKIAALGLTRWHSIWAALLASRRIQYFPGSPFRAYFERSPGYDPGVLLCRARTLLCGYWQSPRYFHSIRAHLLREIQPREQLSEDAKTLEGVIRGSTSVAVHVRRGDYVTLAAAASYHGTCPRSYYESAYAVLRKAAPSARYFIFSDDLDWCAGNLAFLPNAMLIRGQQQSTTPLEELMLMRACTHNIIANSSFSWWGAWLGDNHDKVVIAPKAGNYRDGRNPDLYPAQWTLV